MKQPLEGITVLEFSQYLAGPYAGLRLADLGARVIKVERPGSGDACRQLATKNLYADGDSVVFHTINRNKESYAANLKDPGDLKKVKALIASADVMTHNFRPGVMEKIGLDFESVRAIHPQIIYGEVTGYGPTGPWSKKPGQDLLVQSLGALPWLSGSAAGGPVPMGIAIADIFAGAQLVHGILACLHRGEGGLVEVSMLESLLDFQFEPLTVYFQDGGEEPERTVNNNAHAYVAAPYGLYETSDGWLALAMGSVTKIAELIGCDTLQAFPDPASWWTQRDAIKAILAAHLKPKTTADWLAVLEPADIWCAQVHDWKQLRATEAYQLLGIEQVVTTSNGTTYRTTRCPIRLDGERIYMPNGSPQLGEHTAEILETLN